MIRNQPDTDEKLTAFIEFMLRMICESLHELAQNQADNRNVGQNVGVKLAELTTEDKVLLLLRDNPRITAQGIANTLGKSKRQIERIIAVLKIEKKLERVGASKAGYWVVEDGFMGDRR